MFRNSDRQRLHTPTLAFLLCAKWVTLTATPFTPQTLGLPVLLGFLIFVSTCEGHRKGAPTHVCRMLDRVRALDPKKVDDIGVGDGPVSVLASVALVADFSSQPPAAASSQHQQFASQHQQVASQQPATASSSRSSSRSKGPPHTHTANPYFSRQPYLY